MMQTEWRPESIAIAQALAERARSKGITLLQFAVAWVLANRNVSSVIAGPKTLAQWQDYFGGVGVEWTADDEAAVDALVAPGHPSTPGYSDPQYPFYGRRT
jgi:aryl-alcohol dehydrogenase-like predicted oxidoreductase